MTDFSVDPTKMALINVDMQVAFLGGGPYSVPNALSLIPNVNRLAQSCREAGIMVIHTRHVTRPDGSNIGTLGKLIGAIQDGLLAKGSETAELHPDLDVQTNDIILEKPRSGAFSSTDLDNVLRSHGIDTIIVSGTCTNLCCETTAREGATKDYHVFFVEDGTETFPAGGLTVEEIKHAVHVSIGIAYAKVIRIDKIIDLIQRATK